MSVILLPVAIVFAIIHYYNGGSFNSLTNLASIVFMIWMLDVIIRLNAISMRIKK